MLRHRLLFGAAIAAFAALIAACGGGGGSGSSPLPAGGSTPAKTAGATVRVLIPKSGASSNTRKPAFISPSTATITISVYTVNGATPSPAPVPVSITIATSPDCTTGGSGVSCTITVTVPVVTAVVLQISSYDSTGALLGQGLVGPINTTLATIPAQSVSVGGVPATIALTPSTLSAGDDGLSHAVTFTVSAQDAGGNTIIPPGSYPNPIALSISGDTNGALSLSTTSVASPGPSNGASTVTLTYNSALAISQATITATSGTSTASIPFAPIVFTPTTVPLYVGGPMQTVTVSEAGYGGAFTVGGSSSIATITCVPANCTPSSVGGSITIDVAPGTTVGSETLSPVDSNGGFASIPITLTSSGGGGSLVGAPYQVYEYPTQGGGSNYGISVGPDGQTLWFVDRNNYSLGAVPNPSGCNSTSCTYSEVPVPWQSAPPTDLLALTAASDGNLYVTDPGGGSDSGNLFQVSCTPSPASCSGTDYPSNDFSYSYPPYLTDVLSAPDGNLYISFASDSDGDYSGMAWPSIVGCCSSMPYQINVAGQPSAINMMTFDQTGQTIWFTDQGNLNVGFVAGLPCEFSCNAIEQPNNTSYTNYGPEDDAAHRSPPGSIAGRVHRGGAVPRRPAFVPRRRRALCCGTESSFTGPLGGIVAAPDGNIYVADSSGSIDQISPSVWESCDGNCTFTAIGLPNPSASPQNLTIGRDGNVWFTDSTGYVGFISLSSCSSGTCKAYEYPVPDSGSPWGITAGPDGNIWFTDSSSNKIGKVVL